MSSVPWFSRAHRWRRSAPSNAASKARRRQGCSGFPAEARSCCGGRHGARSAGRRRRPPPGPGASQGLRCSCCRRCRPCSPLSSQPLYLRPDPRPDPSAAGAAGESRAAWGHALCVSPSPSISVSVRAADTRGCGRHPREHVFPPLFTVALAAPHPLPYLACSESRFRDLHLSFTPP